MITLEEACRIFFESRISSRHRYDPDFLPHVTEVDNAWWFSFGRRFKKHYLIGEVGAYTTAITKETGEIEQVWMPGYNGKKLVEVTDEALQICERLHQEECQARLNLSAGK